MDVGDGWDSQAEWIYFDLMHDAFLCGRCEKFLKVKYPIPSGLMKQVLQTFQNMHIRCQEGCDKAIQQLSSH